MFGIYVPIVYLTHNELRIVFNHDLYIIVVYTVFVRNPMVEPFVTPFYSFILPCLSNSNFIPSVRIIYCTTFSFA